MPLQATQQGADKEKAFPNPETLDKSLQNNDDQEKPVNPRDAIFDQMDARLDEMRAEEIAEYDTQTEVNRDETILELEPGLQSQAPLHEEPAGDDTGLPEDLKEDPLAEYIVMDGDAAMFKTKVDGEERLIPLDAARSQLQKHVAAEVRLARVAAERKDLDVREAAMAENEAAFNARQQATEVSPPSVVSDVSDQDLEAEAREVVKTLFEGSETEAVSGLTALLGKTRAPAQVDTQAITNQAVAAAKQQLNDERSAEAAILRKQDLDTGFETFSSDYPEIVRDVNLFRYADGMTDTIEAEHPDWAPSAVMAEAGKRTRSWVESMKAPSEADSQPSDRRNRKRNLKPMPRVRSGTQEAAPAETPDTPQSMMEEIRQARGQG